MRALPPPPCPGLVEIIKGRAGRAACDRRANPIDLTAQDWSCHRLHTDTV